MINVKLPTILREHAGGQPEVQTGGETLLQVLDGLEDQYPGLTGGFRAEDGSLHRHVNVYVNGEDVRYLGGLEAPVSDGDTVSILPAVAGGEDRDRAGGGSLLEPLRPSVAYATETRAPSIPPASCGLQ